MKNPRTESFHEPEVGPDGGQRGPKHPAGVAPHLSPPGAAWRTPPSFGALSRPLFIPVTQKPRNISRFPSFRRGAADTLCSSSGGLI